MVPAEIDFNLIDSGIRTLVRAINATGWMETISSCEGHPERDGAYSAHVELLIRTPQLEGLGLFFDWIALANVLRRSISPVYRDADLIGVDYFRKTQFGYYFVVYGSFLNAVENQRIIQALTEAI